MKVLLATDGSKGADTALRSAARMLQRQDLETDIVCVAPEYVSPQTGWDAGQLRERYRRRIVPQTSIILERAQDILAHSGIDAGTLTRVGSPADEIIGLSQDYDLTVIGARGRGAHSSAGLGPVASRLAERAHPLLIARDMVSDSGFQVLVAVDGSAASRRALDVLPACFDLDSASVVLLHVVETPWVHLGLEDEWFDETDNHDETESELRWRKEVNQQAENLLEAARSILSQAHGGVEVRIAEGNPANEILSEAESGGYDLVVVGATGVSDLKHSLLGSVSLKVAWQAPCSALIVQASDA